MINIQSAQQLGQALRTARKRLGLNQSELALSGRCWRSLYRDLEAGKPSVRLETVMRVIEALGGQVMLDGLPSIVTRPSAPQVLRLQDAVTFDALTDNHGADAKNFSILCREGCRSGAALRRIVNRRLSQPDAKDGDAVGWQIQIQRSASPTLGSLCPGGGLIGSANPKTSPRLVPKATHCCTQVADIGG